MTLRQEVCVTLCSFTEENLLKRNRRQQATSEFLWLSNLVSKLRCAEEAKCEVAFIGMKSKVCSGGENDRRVLGIQCGSVNFFFCGREASTN